MGIQNYLKRISTATKDIKSAIEEKGVPVSQCDGFEQLADKVRAIQTGNGNSLFVMLAFKQSETTPAVPTGGYFSDENITYPTGWSDGAGLTENIWMSYAIIDGNGNFYKNWVSPIKISSGSTSSSIDLTNYATKAWVTEQISKLTGDDIDLSNYYTKSEVDAKIQSAGVSSINDLTGDVTLKGSSSVNITKSGNILTFTATGGSTIGDSYISCYLYKTSSSKDTAPEIPSADTTWDSETKSLINIPAEWSTKVTVTSAAPYVWQIVGTFNTNTGEQIGDWTGPNCISGENGPKGEDGDTIEEVYAVYNSVAVMPTISTSSTDANGKSVSDDGYLPNFMFGTTAVAASGTLLSVDSTNRYLFKSTRRKHNGTWLSFTDPAVVGNWTETELSPEEIEKLKDNIKSDVTDSLTEASQRVDALQTRIDSIDYTKADFIKDPDNALIAAITQYKDDNQKSFADLIVDGKEAEIKALAGAEVNDHLTEAGITIDGLGAKLKSFADYQDETNGSIQTVSSNIDAVKGTLKNYATTEDLTNNIAEVNSAVQELNGKNAEIISSVSKNNYIWVKKDSDGNIIKDSTVTYDASQYLAKDATYTDRDKYEAAMKEQGYELDLSVNAFSQIKQTAGEVDITAGDEKAAQLKIYGDNDTSRIVMKAEQVDFSGNMNGKGLTVTDLTVTGTKGETDPTTNLPQLGATINSAYINECQINSCEIVSQIKSKDYTAETTSEDGTVTAGLGYLLDAAANEFAFYGDKTSDGEVAFKLTNSKLEIPAAYIQNLTTGNITNFSTEIWNIIGAGTIELSKNISTVLAEQADFYVKTLSTKDSNYNRLYIGADAVTTETNSVVYSEGYDSEEIHFNSTKFWEPTLSVGNSITAVSGQTLQIPDIRWQAWGWFAYSINRSAKNETVKLFLVKKNSSGKWEDVQNIYTWTETWGKNGPHNSHNENGKYTTATTYKVTSDGEYALQFRISLEHPGNNAKGWSKLKFSYNAYCLKTTGTVSGDTGITINPTTFVAKSVTSSGSDSVAEASLTIGATGISSKGFVLSPTVTGIKTVTSTNDCNDQNTLYIILN